MGHTAIVHIGLFTVLRAVPAILMRVAKCRASTTSMSQRFSPRQCRVIFFHTGRVPISICSRTLLPKSPDTMSCTYMFCEAIRTSDPKEIGPITASLLVT